MIMETSYFMEKIQLPTNNELFVPLGNTYALWMKICDFVFGKYPAAVEEWNFPGRNYGWSFRIKDKKRAIIYLGPRSGYFRVAFVFGQKAVDKILESDISEGIKTDLMKSKVYMEGRGLWIDLKDETFIDDIKKLITIKIGN